MSRPLEGIKVVEIATWGYVPSAGAVLSDMGADVLKIEPPDGDPIRQLTTAGVAPGAGGFTFMWEIFNRGKRSITMDLGLEGATDLLHKLLAGADVFLTNLLPPTRRKLKIDVEDVTGRHPKIIYAVGSGLGPHGPDGEKGGYDSISFWARGGVALGVTPTELSYPLPMPGAAFGDVLSGMTLAGGIAAAIAQRARTGKASVVDGALFATSLWAMQGAIVGAAMTGQSVLPKRTHDTAVNPINNVYRTADGRHIVLCMLQPQRYWRDLCLTIGRPDLADDPRFATDAGRTQNLTACIKALEEVFASRTLADWKPILSRQKGQWDVVQAPGEIPEDPQAKANGFLQDVDYGDGRSLKMVSVPLLFDREALSPRPAPQLGQHNDEVLTELGCSEEEIIEIKVKGVIY